MIWLAFIMTGAILTAFTGAFFRANPWSLSTWGMVLLVFPITVFTQYAFARAFNTAPAFFIAWFTGTAACSLAALIVSKEVFGEPWKLLDWLGMVYVIIGAALLALGPKL